MTSIQAVGQSPNPGEIVSLFQFDATSVGGDIYYVCMGSQNDGPVSFGGQSYTPIDCEFSDMETNGQGSLPTPRVKIANNNGIFQSLINTYGDMTGCTLKRVRTFRRFLDGEAEADPGSYYGPDWFKVERKVSENPIYIEWELSSSIDQESVQLPKRTVIRNTCLWRYRRWDPVLGQFDYTDVQCPYAGGQSYDNSGNPVSSSEDQCGRRISDCKKRFGEDNPLPFGGFPGVARVRR